MKKLIPALIFGALLVPGAQGSITTYDTRATYEAALLTPTTFDFNQPDGSISALGAAVGISTIGGDLSGQITGDTLCGSLTGNSECFLPLQFTFTSTSFAFGYDNLDLTSDEEAVITVSFSNGDPSQQFTINLGGAADFTPVFFGAISDTAISNVQIYSRTIGTDTIGDRANVIDNVTIDAGAVDTPEPGSWMLMSGGFMLFLGRSMRRRLSPVRE